MAQLASGSYASHSGEHPHSHFAGEIREGQRRGLNNSISYGKTRLVDQVESVLGPKRLGERCGLAPLKGLPFLPALVVLLLAAGCGGGISTESVTSEDLAGLLPDVDTVSSALGVGIAIDQVEERSELSPAFELADIEQPEGAYVGSYRVLNDFSVPTTGSSQVSLALYETPDAADAAMEVITGEFGGSGVGATEFDVADLADAGQGFVFDQAPEQLPIFDNFTWAILRWDSLLAEIVAFNDPGDDLIEEVRALAESVKSNLSAIQDG